MLREGIEYIDLPEKKGKKEKVSRSTMASPREGKRKKKHV